jgi:hypothetical protein
VVNGIARRARLTISKEGVCLEPSLAKDELTFIISNKPTDGEVLDYNTYICGPTGPHRGRCGLGKRPRGPKCPSQSNSYSRHDDHRNAKMSGVGMHSNWSEMSVRFILSHHSATAGSSSKKRPTRFWSAANVWTGCSNVPMGSRCSKITTTLFTSSIIMVVTRPSRLTLLQN